jgi:hypothetical protein
MRILIQSFSRWKEYSIIIYSSNTNLNYVVILYPLLMKTDQITDDIITIGKVIINTSLTQMNLL